MTTKIEQIIPWVEEKLNYHRAMINSSANVDDLPGRIFHGTAFNAYQEMKRFILGFDHDKESYKVHRREDSRDHGAIK